MLIVNRTSRGGRGEYVGISLYYDIGANGMGHHNQGIYRVSNYTDEQLKFMTCFMNCKYIRKYCAGLSLGSKMKEIKKSQFSTIPIPNFPSLLVNEINELYYNKVDESITKNIDSGNFLELDHNWNSKAGIIQLAEHTKQIKKHIEYIIDKIVRDEEIDIDFKFLYSSLI